VTASPRRSFLFATFTLVILFLVLEALLRVVAHLSIDYASRQSDLNYEYKLWQMHLFDSFMGMQEPDPDLFWKMSPGYRTSFVYVNREGLSGPEIAPRQANEFRILFLGDSTPLGLGLPKSTGSFVWQVRALVQKAVPDRKIVVMNGSVAGYSSWQCRRLLEVKGEQLQPDLVVTYFGNNDPSYNGYLSDRQLAELTRHYGWLNRLLGHSYSYQFLKSVVLRIKSSSGDTGRVTERVSVEEYGQNLAAIKSWCDEHKCMLAACSIPTPDLWPPGIQFRIFAGGKDSAGRLVMADRMQQDLVSSWDLCLDTLLLPGAADEWTRRVYSTGVDSLTTGQEETELRRQLQSAPFDPRLSNNLGTILWREGLDSMQYFFAALKADSLNPAAWYNIGICLYRSDPLEAAGYLKRAKELDHYSLRIKEGYNQVVRDFCRSNEIPLIDLESVFTGLPDTEYFVDHCHPTTQGHQLIARQIATVVTSLASKHSNLTP
jgi:lysophospholipase L1-like esterase